MHLNGSVEEVPPENSGKSPAKPKLGRPRIDLIMTSEIGVCKSLPIAAGEFCVVRLQFRENKLHQLLEQRSGNQNISLFLSLSFAAFPLSCCNCSPTPLAAS